MTASTRSTSTLGTVVLSEMPVGESFSPSTMDLVVDNPKIWPGIAACHFRGDEVSPACQNSAVPKSGRPVSPLRIRLSPERRSMLVDAIKRHFDAEFDEPLSDFRAEQLLDFFVAELGPPVYNQGVRDASSNIADKLIDIEGDVFEVEAQ
jgi:uncharacterized protein (DUF2164 family)